MSRSRLRVPALLSDPNTLHTLRSTFQYLIKFYKYDFKFLGTFDKISNEINCFGSKFISKIVFETKINKQVEARAHFPNHDRILLRQETPLQA